MNRPTHVRDLPQPPLALVGHRQEETPGPVPPRTTQAGQQPAQDTDRPPGDRRDPGRPSRQDGAAARPASQDAALRAELQERTADLQRLKAEYDNYRKRVHRDRLAVGEIAVANVLSRLLPVLDALAEAGEQGEVTGGFQRIAEALETELGALGLQPFGMAGTPFDPLIHEAVTYTPDDRLEESVCTAVLRQGYRVGDRLLRPAQVTVAGKPPAGA
ncbi:molecular chaperone GrpE [Streptomyces sp. 2224.1]|uniref:nucleotide exchange factor GrpE n=1 Tax=unclassified Streptomyces TaxID=2593676 RepID=UPI00088A1ACF|nr:MULTISPECIES: nucleotide exchange factor GrpE [unclassified Streptomyces]PBC80666.1 molecular chaperone GrpE [Streptomyces sp. 2321.6]SDR57719.1 molecular chaperone GrpE [Streptomyces sp. KS_16]SEB83764.1 molecular chaperone GrpE [Streptomyces sp. 2133.1]SED41610.1 molecular chaperone GrpE [Streptomyces sp. 2224.1]SEF13588.1 molecular chaperone GrpE [Streptomyces sp. 2112.3]